MKKIAIRELAYFVYQEGDLTSEQSFNSTAIEGTNLHTLRQSEYGSESKSEYYVNKILEYNGEQINLIGYVDGILEYKKYLELEEIKTTSKEIYHEKFTPKKEHLAQLKIYGYLLLLDSSFDEVKLNLLYIERSNLKRRNYEYTLQLEELKKFFFDTLDIYLAFFNKQLERQINRLITTKNIKFPFENSRKGQIEMSSEIVNNFKENGIMYFLAPTGIGKTMSSIFGAVKSMTAIDDKLFYLTAKSSGKNSAINAIKILIENGLKIKALVLTAKRKICMLNSKTCKEDECPYTIDFFTKLKDATNDIIDNNDIITEKTILDYSFKYEICSFEYSLNISTNVDVIICDYNYVFDPKVKLIRFFEEGNYKPLILVDEAHNLLSRSLDMYSTKISIYNLLELKKICQEIYPSVARDLLKLINYIHKTYDGLIVNGFYYTMNNDLEIENYIYLISDKIQTYLEENENIKEKDSLLEGFFLLKDYLRISRLYGDSHIFLIKLINNNLEINLSCLDASNYLNEIVNKHSKGIAYFSATLYPISYYKDLLSAGLGNYLELESPFNPDNFKIIVSPISTRYKDRMYSLSYLVNTIKATISAKKGRYIVFFPSYEYLNLCSSYLEVDDYEIIKQEPGLSEYEQRELLDKFKSDDNILGMFVLGGIFAEGIDFIGDLLHGVLIVGVGFPQINLENELLKDFFDTKYNLGMLYAYTYPGFNKVIQAAGRVIRTETDRGILVLLDDRYLSKTYKNLFPSHWKNIKTITNIENLEIELKNFWKEK